MQNLARGQKLKLSDLSPSLGWQVGISALAPGLTFDISCFGVDASGKLSDDRYFVFFNQTATPESAITMQEAPDGASFDIDLARLPNTIRRLVFVLTLDGGGTMSQLSSGHVSLSAGGSELARFELKGTDFATEKAIMAAEIYFKDVWRAAAVGQGFAGGLAAVLKHFGGQEIEEGPAPSAPAIAATPELQPVAPTPPTAASTPVSAPMKAPVPSAWPSETPASAAAPKTVSLTKAGSSVKIDLGKKSGEIVATATWVDNGDNRSDNDDLDLRAGILFPDGSMSIVTCTKPGSLSKKPYVSHQGDIKSASAAAPGQETMKVSAQIGDNLGGDIAIVFSIYSAIANGPVAIASLKPQMKLQFGGQTVECALDFNADKNAKKHGVYTYVIGLAVIRNGQIEISPGGQVSTPGSEATPWLKWDRGAVQVTMDGPAVVKSGGKVLEGLLNAGNKKRYV